MHALATAKAGSLGDERYISYSLFVESSKTAKTPKMAVFHASAARQSRAGIAPALPPYKLDP